MQILVYLGISDKIGDRSIRKREMNYLLHIHELEIANQIGCFKIYEQTKYILCSSIVLCNGKIAYNHGGLTISCNIGL